MDTANIVMSMVLCAIIGFAIGNVWGKETMKRTFQELIGSLINGFKKVTDEVEKNKEETK